MEAVIIVFFFFSFPITISLRLINRRAQILTHEHVRIDICFTQHHLQQVAFRLEPYLLLLHDPQAEVIDGLCTRERSSSTSSSIRRRPAATVNATTTTTSTTSNTNIGGRSSRCVEEKRVVVGPSCC